MPGGEQDVLGLDVAMHDVARMRVAQGGRHLADELERLLERELPLALQAVAQRLSLHVRHHVVEQAAGRTGVVDGEDVRVL